MVIAVYIIVDVVDSPSSWVSSLLSLCFFFFSIKHGVAYED